MTNVITAEFFNVSLKCLRIPTLRIISNLLNPIKYIPTKENLPRDWRGLADLMGYNQEDISSFQCTPDSTLSVLTKWSESKGSTIKMFLLFLNRMDRFDVYDDIVMLVVADINSHKSNVRQNIDTSAFITVSDRKLHHSLPPKQYDASILYADDDAKFAAEVITILEQQYRLDIFLKERDLIGGTIEHDATMQVIAKRSNRLIIILSPAFLESSENKYFTSFAQSIGIEQRRRKIIPCIYKDCEIPYELKPLHKLDYRRSGILYNFYEKLYSSIIPAETVVALPRSAENTPVPMRSTLTVPQASTKSMKEHSSLPDLSIKSDTTTSDTDSDTISRSSLSPENHTPAKKTILTKFQKIFKKKQKLVAAS
ncbi:myd88 [Holotrichia oblita]|uniref:Myd88 n=1 Tax=Holotrichia oblita TaxID=644536 RepID=A0ACB9T4X6_HOLOL|nr:myd88 [Holotrichia oblita]